MQKNSELKREYIELFEAISEILFRYDPIFINFETNTDEYYPEARTILPRLKYCNSVDEVAAVTHEEFLKWFGEDSGEVKDFKEIAVEIWAVWMKSKLV